MPSRTPPVSLTGRTPFSWRVPALISLAVFAQESTWNFYDAQVPPLLRNHVSSAALIGLLMGLDNVLGIFVQPWMGSRSDRTRTRWGRRIPYIVAGTPVAAVLFMALPFTTSFPALVTVMFLYALVANSYKPVAEALMPDFVAAEHRSKANALTRIAASLTIVVSSLVSVLLVDHDLKLAFAVPALLMIAAVGVLVLTVKERRAPAYQEAVADSAAPDGPPSARLRDVLGELLRDRDRSRVWMLTVVFLVAGAWAASRALMTPYGTEVLGLTKGRAGGLGLPGGIAFIIAAFPVALLAGRVGRLRLIRWGLVLFIAAMVLGVVVRTPLGTSAAVVLGAVGYATFSVNAVVVLWDLAPSRRVLGTYTALYGVGNATGSALGPALVGLLVDLTGWAYLLLDVAIVAALALFALTRISRIGRTGHERAAPDAPDVPASSPPPSPTESH
ncbi:MFS transporter [Streptomyces sp. NPDC059883]|uniref:MFS transporter n=1 Tax=unclassified Streptomyces TaxID=2593676 RepID=UPI00365F5943